VAHSRPKGRREYRVVRRAEEAFPQRPGRCFTTAMIDDMDAVPASSDPGEPVEAGRGVGLPAASPRVARPGRNFRRRVANSWLGSADVRRSAPDAGPTRSPAGRRRARGPTPQRPADLTTRVTRRELRIHAGLRQPPGCRPVRPAAPRGWAAAPSGHLPSAVSGTRPRSDERRQRTSSTPGRLRAATGGPRNSSPKDRCGLELVFGQCPAIPSDGSADEPPRNVPGIAT
jgi:hypothetical protein